MTPPTFHDASAVVPFLVLSVALHGATVFLTTSLNVAKRTRALPVAAAVAAAVTVAGHVTLIPRFGLLGAAGATAAGQAARVIVMAIAAQRLYHIPYETGRLFRTAVVGLVVYAATGFAPADVSAEALIVRGGLLAAFPLALVAAGVVDRDALRRLRARGHRARRAAALRTGGTGVTVARTVEKRFKQLLSLASRWTSRFPDKRFIFISGFHHSGTTLVQEVLRGQGALHVR